jgi:hypothetical protein
LQQRVKPVERRFGRILLFSGMYCYCHVAASFPLLDGASTASEHRTIA